MVQFFKMKNFVDLPNAIYKDEFSSGTFYSTPKTSTFQFECLNPLKTTSFAEEMGIDIRKATREQLIKRLKTRKDSNVSSMRNFIFECDNSTLKEQVERASFLKEKKVLNRIVFSGNKSLHCRITINEDPESLEHYKWLWGKMNEKFFGGLADRACSNPARLTRKPNGVRIKAGKEIVQKLIFEDNTIIFDATIFSQSWEIEKAERKIHSLYRERHKVDREPRNALIIDELESMPESSQEKECWQKAWALAQNDGTLTYQEAASAVSYLGCLGFIADEIVQQIEFGKWNFKKEYIEKILERI